MSLENRFNIIQQLAPFEKIPQKRLHPAPIAKSYLSGTKHPTLSDQSNPEFITNNYRSLTDAEREEQLGLDGIVAYWMVDGANKMRQQRPPYGLVFSKNGFNEEFSDQNMEVVDDANLFGDPFTTFAFAIHHTFAHALEQKRRHIFTVPEGHEAAIYRKCIEYIHHNGTKSEDPNGIKSLAFAPKVAVRIMGDILAHAPDIDSTSLGRKVSFDESVSAARNSTPLILKLSSFEEEVFGVIDRSMNEGGGIWRSLKFVENEGKMYYQIKDAERQHAIDQLSHPEIKEKIEKKSRAGCPARMRFEGKESAIETLWNWYIDYSVKASHKTPTISR